ncbi:MAG: RDD family protein [Desulfobulbaceae bacterium]|nr:RDD family protein [Desulfobulbaceae bacterium]
MIVECPECNSVDKRSDELAGTQVSCPRCKASFVAEGSRQKMWYYADGDNKIGPIKQDSFDGLVDDGIIKPDTLVWCKGMDGWQPLQASTDKCDKCHGTFVVTLLQDHNGIRICGSCKLLAAGETANTWSGLEFGGIGSRVIAKILDLTLMLVFALMIEGLSRKLFPAAYSTNVVTPVFAVTVLINMLLGVFYITWFVGKLGATPGKMVVKLKITNPAGGKIGYGQAFGRYCGEYIAALGLVCCLTLFAFWAISSFFPLNPVLASVSGAIVCAAALVYGPAVFDPQKRTLYDRLCKTRVLAA